MIRQTLDFLAAVQSTATEIELDKTMSKRDRKYLASGADSYVYANAERTKVYKIYKNSNYDKLVSYKKMLDICSQSFDKILLNDYYFYKISSLSEKLAKNIRFEIVPLNEIRRVNSKTALGVSNYIPDENLNYIITGRGKKNSVLSELNIEGSTQDALVDLVKNIYNYLTRLDGGEFDFVNLKLVLEGGELKIVFTDILSQIKYFDFDKWEKEFTQSRRFL